MALETFNFIDSLNASNPVGATDPKSQGDDHIRGIKSTIKSTWPNVTGAITLTHTQQNNAAIKTEANVFTAQQTVEAADARLQLRETGVTVDNARWNFRADGEALYLQTLNDAESALASPMVIERNGTSVDSIALNVAATEAAILAEANGAVRLYHNAIQRFLTQASGVASVRSDGNTDSETRRLVYEHQDGTDRAAIGHAGSGELQIENFIHGSAVRITAEDAGGVEQSLFYSDPDGIGRLYYDGAQSFQTSVNGVEVADPFGNPEINFYNINFSSRRGQIRFTGTDAFIDNEVHGGRVIITGEDAGGVSRNVFLGDPDNLARLYYSGTARFETSAGGAAALFSDGSSDLENRFLGFFHAAGTRRGYVGHDSAGTLALEQEIHGYPVSIRAEDAGGTLRNVLVGDPDALTYVRGDTTVELQCSDAGQVSFQGNSGGQSLIYYNGALRFESRASGVMGLRSDGNTDTEDRYIDFMHANGARRGIVGHITSSTLSVRNAIHGGNVNIQSEDAGGSVRNLFTGDPDGIVELYEDAVVTFRTADRTAADKGTGAEVLDGEGTFQPVGTNNLPQRTGLSSGNVTLAQSNAGCKIEYDTATARSIFANNDGNIKVGSCWSVVHGPSGGTLTLDGGTGVTIRYWNGASYTTTAAAGNITLGEGRHFIEKLSDTSYQVDGPNIS